MASFIKFDQIAKKVNNKNLLANFSLGVQKDEVLFLNKIFITKESK